VKRRDFLLFRTEGGSGIAELSCEKLFMHFQHLSTGYRQSAAEAGKPADADYWAGEPTLHIHGLDPESFFRSVLNELGAVKKITVRDMEWLGRGEFRVRVETLLAAFRARGGEVSFQPPTQARNQNSSEDESYIAGNSDEPNYAHNQNSSEDKSYIAGNSDELTQAHNQNSSEEVASRL
jgi:hypothetical protein